jgi:transposase InsO family protein
MSERKACQLAKQPRGTQRYQPTQREDEDELTRAIIAVASQYGRYGYRRVTALLQRAGWRVGKDRVERISTPRTKTYPWGPRSGVAKGCWQQLRLSISGFSVTSERSEQHARHTDAGRVIRHFLAVVFARAWYQWIT